MPLSAVCPGCRTTFKFADTFFGKKVKCKKCNQRFIVGSATADVAGAGDTVDADAHEEGTSRSSALHKSRKLRDDQFREAAPDVLTPAQQRERAKKMVFWGVGGGVGLLFLILLLVGINSMKDETGKETKRNPSMVNVDPPIITPHSPIHSEPAPVTPSTTSYGPDKTVTLHITDIPDEATRLVIQQRLEMLIDAPPPSLKSTQAGAAATITLAPVQDPKALAAKIDFAVVKGVEGRVINLSAKKSVAQNTLPPIRNVNPAPFEPPAPAAEERPAVIPPPALWKLAVDPQANPLKFTGKAQRGVPFTRDQKAIVPSTPANVLALYGSTGGAFVVTPVNLQTMKPGKKLTIPSGLTEPMALSPDGNLLAGKSGSNLDSGTTVEVWNFSTGKRAQQIPVDLGRTTIDFIDFGKTGQLVVIKSAAGKRTVQLWDTTKGEKIKEWPGPQTIAAQAAAMSPGRKYLAVGEPEKLTVYDLGAGSAVGEVNLPKPDKFWKQECTGLAFSPDGSELAGVFETAFKSRILSWDVAKGELVADHSFDKKLSWGYKGTPLEWLLGKGAWLVYGKLLIEHDTGKLVWEVPSMDRDHEMRVLGRDRLLEIAYSIRGNALAISALPLEQLDTAITATRTAWAALKLPAAQPGDLSAVRMMPAPSDQYRTIEPDGQPPKGQLGRGMVTLFQKEGDIQKILFTRADVGQAAVISAIVPNQLFSRKVLRLDRYDVNTGQMTGGMNLCLDPQYRFWEGEPPIDLSSDGAAVVVKGREDRRRVDVWSLADGKHTAGWLPYAQEKETLKNGEKTDVVSWVGFIDSRHVVTLNPTGKLVVWSIPDCKPIYGLSDVRRGSIAISPGRKYLAALQGTSYGVYMALSGDAVGKLPWPSVFDPNMPNLTTAATFSPEGDQLAATIAGQMVCWDARTGKEISAFGMSQVLTDLIWFNQHFLVGRTAQFQSPYYLVDVSDKAVVCSYIPGFAKVASGTPDGRLWYTTNSASQGMAPQPMAAQMTILAARDMPDSQASELIRSLKDPNTPMKLRPGARVTIRLHGECSETVKQALLEQLSNRLRANGYEPSESGEAVLDFQTRLESTGKMLQYNKLMGGGGQISVPVQKLTCQASLGNGSASWWVQNTATETAGSMMEHIRQDDDLSARLTDRLWQSSVYFAGSLSLPSRILDKNGEAIPLPVAFRIVPEAGGQDPNSPRPPMGFNPPFGKPR